jgi:hypothetical protein
MTRRLALLVVLAIAAAASLRAGDVATSPPAFGAISGLVTDAQSGAAIHGAVVQLAGGPDRPGAGKVVTTDSLGRFVFPLVEPGETYYLEGQRHGYAPGWNGLSTAIAGLPGDRIPRIRIVPGQWKQNVAISLSRWGEICGDARDERGEPISGVVVRSYRRLMVRGQLALVASGTAMTDDRGSYRIASLYPGEHIVSVPSVQSTVPMGMPDGERSRPVGSRSAQEVPLGSAASVDMPPIAQTASLRQIASIYPIAASRRGQPRAYSPTFYPTAVSPSDAVGVKVGPGTVVHGIDIYLQARASAPLAGRLTNIGTVAEPTLLRLLLPGTESLGVGGEVATTFATSDGSFEFLNVPTGNYVLVAQNGITTLTEGGADQDLPDPPGFAATSRSAGAVTGSWSLQYTTVIGRSAAFFLSAPVQVTTQPAAPLEIAVQPFGRLVGTVLLDGTTQLPKTRTALAFRAWPATFNASVATMSGDLVSTGARHDFVIDGLAPGLYELAPSSLQIKSITSPSGEVQDGVIQLAPGEERRLSVILTDHRTELSGHVRASEARLDEGVSVVVFPANPARWSSMALVPRGARSVRAGHDGVFLVKGLPEGDYLVAAIPSAATEQWLDEAWLKNRSRSADRVTVRLGSPTQMDLTVR